MKKHNLISVLLTVLVASAAIIGSAYALNYLRTPDKNTPEQTVGKFFAEWVEYDGNPLVDRYYAVSPLISESYVQKVDAIIASFDKGGFDPILCAQDFPQEIRITNTSFKENNAVITIEKVFSGNSMMAEVVLEQTNGKWLINDIICQEGQAGEGDLNAGVSPAIQTMVGDYIRENISELSPEEAVLGGTFYVTSIRFTGPNTAIVDYEDGHIALSADVQFNVPSAGEVEIESFELRDEDKNTFLPATNYNECLAAGNEEMKPDCVDCQAYCETEDGRRFEENDSSGDSFCEDLCGDGTCQEMVCMAEGCPCAETPESCPEDCRE